MSKAEVQQVSGEPTVVRGAIRNRFNQAIEIWQYQLVLPDSVGQTVRDYWFYFLRDELVQWGEAGDWSREPDRIHHFDFEPHPTAPQ